MSRPAYLDEKGVRWDTNEADMEGVMSKKSKWLGEWRERYFILKGPKMFFTKSASEAPHGIIDLVDCLRVEGVAGGLSPLLLEMQMREKERFVLRAPSAEHKNAWIAAISRAIVIATSAHFEE